MSERPTPESASGDAVVLRLDGGEIAIFSHGPNAMSLFEPESGRIVDVNDAWTTLYGYSREDARTMRTMDVSAEPGETRAAQLAARTMGGAQIRLRWHKRRDGTIFPVELTSGTLRLGGRMLMYAVITDISERLRAQTALEKSEARFRAVIESMPDAVVVHRDWTILYINPAARALFAFGDDEPVAGIRLLDLVAPSDRASVQGRVQAIVEQHLPAPRIEERLQRRDGTQIDVEVSGIPIEFDGRSAVLAMVRDLRDRKRMESQLVLADRLASLGRLAASVGHEINNPLAYVLGNVQLLEREILHTEELSEESRQRLQQRLAVIQEGAGRVRDIVRDLKTLSSGERHVIGPVDLHRVLDLAANMAEHEIRHRARLVRDYGEPAFLQANEARLGQVFLNLLVNAAQAITDGNVLDNEVRIVTRRVSGDRVSVEIRDTGNGIAPEHRDRVFEPFFTTKESGGTGLGLSISHSIVTDIGGSIDVVPNEPRGTTFRVVLPLHTDQGEHPVEGQPRGDLPAHRPATRARVLVVDAERRHAEALRELLDEHEVALANAGQDAIERLSNEEFDAILLDAGVTGTHGIDVYRWIRQHRPDTSRRVVFMTGGPLHDLTDIDDIGSRAILQKPFDSALLRRALDAILDP